MEGVGARLGRSSTRYGCPTTVFNGPVRRWKKKWVHVSPYSSSNNSTNHNSSHHHYSQSPNTAVNGNNGSNVILFKWTPIPGSSAATSSDKTPVKDASSSQLLDDDASRRKFKYIPIAALEEQKDDAAEQVEDDTQAETDVNGAEPTHEVDDSDEKPDINDEPMEESQAADKSRVKRQDLNESTLDLSLG